ncbi:MAG: EAL domain-containing protein [Sulfuriferula multivorans]|uniref:EAL domain-containing protein n=1 Tax=Sulfuriferula multivorans TaxID=1559896 RepID=A0A7C9NQS1_9PROT|nr:EAL domain-containing protein [Sulfuriferula multivorans]
MHPSSSPTTPDTFRPLAAVTGFAVTVVGILLGYLLWSGYTEALRAADTNSQNLVWMLESRLDTTLRRVEAVVEVTADTIPREATNKQAVPHYAPLIEPKLDAQLRHFPELSGLRFYDAEGDLLYTTASATSPRINIKDRPYFKLSRVSATTTTTFSKVIVSRVTGRKVLVMTRPVRDANGHFLGIISGVLDLDVFQELLRSIDVGQQGLINIRRSDDFSSVLRQPEKAGEINKPLPQQHPVVQALLAGESAGTKEYVAVSDAIPRIWSFRKLEHYPFYVQIALSSHEVRTNWYQRTFAVLAIGLVLLAFLSWLLMRLRHTERREAQAKASLSQQGARLQLLAKVFEHSAEAIMITDADNRIIEVNHSFTDMTGYTLVDAQGQNPSMLASGRTTPEEYRAMWQSILTDNFWQGEIWSARKDGSLHPIRLSISTVQGEGNAIENYIGSFTDISEHQAATEQIHHLAYHDTLTGLANRLSLQGRLEQALASAKRDNKHVAVLFIDLDRFKDINDSLGHQTGDRLLIEVANRLKAKVRETDIVARLGGDEFVVVLTDIKTAAVAMWTDKILVSLDKTYHIESYQLNVSASIGVAISPEDGDDINSLMKHADAAMYHAKSAGRNNVQFFTRSITQASFERIELGHAMNRALEQRQFVLHYQPLVDFATGNIISLEALVRWQHPVKGLIPPDKFIPIAEETGFIEPLGLWVLNEALHQLALWRASGIATTVRMGINLSVHQLRMHALPETIGNLLVQHQLTPPDLELEITESAAMQNPQVTTEILGRLRAMGVELAIDDFGTGYSSLSYLKLLPIHRLKLDRSFVRDIEHDPNDAAICSATIAMAHSLSLSVVAEGVETHAQRDFLGTLGCDILQGYLFSRPLPAAELEAFLRSQ